MMRYARFMSKAKLRLFGPFLKKLRRAKGFSGNSLALSADVHQGTLSQIETGSRKATPDFCKKIAPSLGESAERLIAWAQAERLGKEVFLAILKYGAEIEEAINQKSPTAKASSSGDRKLVDLHVTDEEEVRIGQTVTVQGASKTGKSATGRRKKSKLE